MLASLAVYLCGTPIAWAANLPVAMHLAKRAQEPVLIVSARADGFGFSRVRAMVAEPSFERVAAAFVCVFVTDSWLGAPMGWGPGGPATFTVMSPKGETLMSATGAQWTGALTSLLQRAQWLWQNRPNVESAYRKDPRLASTALPWAEILGWRGKGDEAIRVLRSGLSGTAPTEMWGRTQGAIAEGLYAQGRFVEAREWFASAARNHPEACCRDNSALREAVCLMRTGELSEAQKRLRNLLEGHRLGNDAAEYAGRMLERTMGWGR